MSVGVDGERTWHSFSPYVDASWFETPGFARLLTMRRKQKPSS
jgi:hypothetical protein